MSFKKYLTNKFSTRKFRFSDILLTTYLPSTKRISQGFRHHLVYKGDQFPSKVDLRSDITPIDDQPRIDSSIANCLAEAYEYLIKKSNGRTIVVSRLFIHYNARVKGNNVKSSVDSGCTITNAIKALEEFGTCLESLWPYDISRVNTRPDNQAYEQAAKHKLHKAFRIDVNLNEMKSCLAQGFPFAFGLKMFTSFDQAAQTGDVPIPNVWEQDRPSNESYALLAVGYNDRSKTFIVRNSWGEDWGDKGYCYIPYEYMTDADLCFDVWTIRQVANDDFGQERCQFDGLSENSSSGNNERDYSSDGEYQESLRDYYNRKSVREDSLNEYRNYEVKSLARNNDDYLDDRYRRDRYDRDNELLGGQINNGFNASRTYSCSFYDRFQDEDNYSLRLDDDFKYNNRKSTF